MSFVPLSKRTGIFIGDFARKQIGRDFIIWGAGVLGRCLMQQLAQYSSPEQKLYFSDSDDRLSGKQLAGYDVLQINQAIQRVRTGTAFIIIALAGHQKAAVAKLNKAGLKADIDYVYYQKISRPEAVIQISGQGDSGIVNMTPDIYRAIFFKLKRDVPDLFQIDLSGWGDPLDHPDIAEIITVTAPVVPCSVITHLKADKSTIENSLMAHPTQFVVSVDRPFTQEPEWDTFVDKLSYVAELQTLLAGQTEIRLKYSLFRDTTGPTREKLKAICKDLGIRMIEGIGYIDPYDRTLELCEQDRMNAPEIARLSWSMPEALELAKTDRERPCLCQRIFPVINPDTSVGICHLYTRPKLHQNFLQTDFASLQDIRFDAQHCRICQHHALHRLDIDVLQSRHTLQLVHC
jgi:hypothetical protein